MFESDQEEQKNYGFENVQVQHWAIETVESWAQTIRQSNGYLDPSTEEQNLMTIDDTWLKLAQIMWTRDRKNGRLAREASFKNKQRPEWAVQAIQDVRKRKQVFTRAGEVVCYFAGVGADTIMYMREGEAPTILDIMDPVQLLIPAPVLSNINRSKVIESLLNDKPKTVTILAEALESSLLEMKSHEQELLASKFTPEEV